MTRTRSRITAAAPVIPAATFLVGLLIGALFVGLGQSGNTAAGKGGSQGDQVKPTASASPSGELTVTIPGACRAAAENLRTATALLADSAKSVKNFDPNQLVKLLNELESLDSRTRPLIAQCSEVDISSASPAPSPSP